MVVGKTFVKEINEMELFSASFQSLVMVGNFVAEFCFSDDHL